MKNQDIEAAQGDVDVQELSYNFLIFEQIREILKVGRTDWNNQDESINSRLNSLNDLEALMYPLIQEKESFKRDKQKIMEEKELEEQTKQFFTLLIRRLYEKGIIPRSTPDKI